MTELAELYCPECDAEVLPRYREQPAHLAVRGEDTAYSEEIAVCPQCGHAIGDARIEGANLERAYDAYRAKHDIMSPAGIKSLRQSYGLSMREFSKFLGFGEQTTYRYERGDIPDQAHNNTLQSARTAAGARLLLSQNGSRLLPRSVKSIRQHLIALEYNSDEESHAATALEARESDTPSAANGYRSLDLRKVQLLVYHLAASCTDLYWTKLQKACFFTDMVHFERTSTSFTGLMYAHATYGPVIDHREDVRYLLAEQGTVSFQEKGYGEVLIPRRLVDDALSPDELSLIDQVAAFINSFETAADLSSFSHGLSCWRDTRDGEIIEYTRDKGEVGRALADRMAASKQ